MALSLNNRLVYDLFDLLALLHSFPENFQMFQKPLALGLDQ